MQSENVAAAGTPQLPPSLQADHREFVQALSGLVGPERVDIHVLHLLTKFGLLVHEHADRLGLISKRDRSTLFTRHVLDSLNPISLFDRPPASALDVGSGGGFPGIPLAAVWPSATVTLLERRERKAGFLERAVRELGLRNSKVIPSRLEDLAAGLASQARPDSRQTTFDSVFIRALGSLPDLLGSLGPVTAPGARWVYFLGAGSSADKILSGLGPLGRSAEVARGQFGGQLLHGRLNEGGG
ncbi:MAG TPA: 16S rRNA (guanine(527)-N(7))-methyltransferase RsmG [Candidatus Eisenbacteria bacterium]|nr:16S rRNA (guanine(527)-N(7))-methyltransferase RsmG [Candidatus Eisenbacteria bacterium]